jgi:predicted methyltransferase
MALLDLKVRPARFRTIEPERLFRKLLLAQVAADPSGAMPCLDHSCRDRPRSYVLGARMRPSLERQETRRPHGASGGEMRIFGLAGLFLALALTAVAAPAAAQAPAANPPADAMTDPSLKREEVIAFIGVKPGDQVADIIAGRFARALSAAVGPTGKLYAVEPTEVVKVHPEVMQHMTDAAAAEPGRNIQVMSAPVNALGLPGGLDAVFIRQNYHDLHDKFMGPADMAAFNRQVFAALKPGGVYVVLDHAAAPGSGLTATETLHRIDPAAVKAEVTQAGFIFDGESAILANPADPHDKRVFDPSIRGKTDQFLYRFRKPR